MLTLWNRFDIVLIAVFILGSVIGNCEYGLLNYKIHYSECVPVCLLSGGYSVWGHWGEFLDRTISVCCWHSSVGPYGGHAIGSNHGIIGLK